MSGLSAEQAESLSMFKSVTSIDSEDEARRRLEAASWDLQIAVDRFLNGDSVPEAPLAAEGAGASAGTGGGGVQRTDGGNLVAAANRPQLTPAEEGQPQGGGRFRRFFRAIFFPIWLVISIASFIGEKISGLVRGPRAIEDDPSRSETQSFNLRFDRLYSTVHPTFFDGTLLEALAAAEARFQFLLVFLHSELHPSSARFAARVLSTDDVIRYIDENFVLWARAVSTPEGIAAQRMVGANTFPFLAIMSSLRGRSEGVTLSILEGETTSGDLLTWLRSAMQRFGSSLTRARAERDSRDQARLLREQQDQEYNETLEADRRREREQREAEQRKAEEEEAARQEEERKKQELEDLAQRRALKEKALEGQPEKGAGVTTIALRLPDGRRVDRRFLVEDSVGKLFDWADVQGVSIEHAALVSSFPRKMLQYPEDADKSIDEVGLSKGAMLLIEERPDL